MISGLRIAMVLALSACGAPTSAVRQAPVAEEAADPVTEPSQMPLTLLHELDVALGATDMFDVEPEHDAERELPERSAADVRTAIGAALEGLGGDAASFEARLTGLGDDLDSAQELGMELLEAMRQRVSANPCLAARQSLIGEVLLAAQFLVGVGETYAANANEGGGGLALDGVATFREALARLERARASGDAAAATEAVASARAGFAWVHEMYLGDPPALPEGESAIAVMLPIIDEAETRARAAVERAASGGQRLIDEGLAFAPVVESLRRGEAPAPDLHEGWAREGIEIRDAMIEERQACPPDGLVRATEPSADIDG